MSADGGGAASRVAVPGAVEVLRVPLNPADGFPNNPKLPLFVYRGAWSKSSKAELVGLLRANGWDEPWYGHVYPWQHYHDTTWEGLVVTRGESNIQFGGPHGPVLSVTVGDVVLIPPGVAHNQPGGVPRGFEVAGTYPSGDPPVAELRAPPTPEQQAAIDAATLFKSDPIFGESGAPWGSPDRLISLPATAV